MILIELGQPDDFTPAPVANAVQIATEGLRPTDLSTFEDNDRLKDHLARAHVVLESVEEHSADLPVVLSNAIRAVRTLPPDIEAAIDLRKHRGQ